MLARCLNTTENVGKDNQITINVVGEREMTTQASSPDSVVSALLLWCVTNIVHNGGRFI